MKKLAAFIALFFLTAVVSQAATTIVVTHNGTDTTYTDMPSAEAAFAAGDTMDIQAFDSPMPWAGNCPSWTTVKCTAASPATLLVDPAQSFGAFDHLTLDNLIIDGQCTADQHNGAATLFNGGTASTVTNCTLKGAWWTLVYYANGSMSGDVQDPGVTFTNCYFISGAGSCISFTSQYVTAPATITNKAIIDHCTFIGIKDGPSMELDPNFAGKDLKDVFSLRNSIISGRQSAVGINYHGAILTDPANQVDEDYNVFDAWWNPLYDEGGNGADPVGAHSVKYDYRNNATNPAAEIFTDYAAGDYTLRTGIGSWAPNNICVKTASDGGNIGADQRTLVPVELSSFSAE